MKYFTPLLFALTVAITTPAVANDTSDFNTTYQRASQGNAEAQSKLGSMYYNGKGTPQDYTKAAEWWTKAANQGYAKAQHNLGVVYDSGQGVPQNYTKAIEWYTKAAHCGLPQALVVVRCYLPSTSKARTTHTMPPIPRCITIALAAR